MKTDKETINPYSVNDNVSGRPVFNEGFEAGANWQKEQLLPLLQSHAELLAIVKEFVLFNLEGDLVGWLKDVDKSDGKELEQIFISAKSAIEKANQLTNK